MSGLSKGLEKVEVGVKWDPSPVGSPPHDLDLVAATYTADGPPGAPAYLVHFDSRSPDGTITLDRDSRDGQGFGFDEVMTLELDRLSSSYVRVIVGVVIQQRDGRLTFSDVASTGLRVREGYEDLSTDDFSGVPGATAAVIAEFTRGEDGEWVLHPTVRGFDTDPAAFTDIMGRA